MHDFQKFQLAFGRHIRDPRRAPRPADVPARRMAIYNELLFNNLTGFLDACFPIAQQILGEKRWRRLQRSFFRTARCRTPYFREIPRAFLDWLPPESGPRWLAELAHYEWVELALDVIDAATPAHDPQGDLMAGMPVLAPALMNLAYAWPVQRIGPDYRPRKAQPTHLLVYRDAADDVQFIELNPVSARLVDLLQEARLTGHAACSSIAGQLGLADAQPVIRHGAALLAQLHSVGAILGVKP